MNLKRLIAAVLCTAMCAASASCTAPGGDSSQTSRKQPDPSAAASSEAESELNYIEWHDDGWYLHIEDGIEKYNLSALWADSDNTAAGSHLQVFEEGLTAQDYKLTEDKDAKDMIAFISVLDKDGNETRKITAKPVEN